MLFAENNLILVQQFSGIIRDKNFLVKILPQEYLQSYLQSAYLIQQKCRKQGKNQQIFHYL